MAGVFYGVGVGPGDPELMTQKAVRTIREHTVIALPGAVAEETIAYRIAVQAVPELAEKELVAIPMPMTHDRRELERHHREGAQKVESYLERGEDVVFLTLGDPTIYSTFTYLQLRVEQDGYTTAMVSGIPSFCAAAASANVPLVKWNEQLHIVPAVHCVEQPLLEDGQYVLMKSGRKIKQVKEILNAANREVVTVENCSMPEEQTYWGAEAIPDDAGYYSLIIAKEPEDKR
jgi:precorrin-2/cobalt-factor-2 C20-methyltransferase